MNRAELEQSIAETYRAAPDYPWEGDPSSAVFRHGGSRKWFALIMTVPRARLGLQGSGNLDIVNFKCDPALIGSLRLEEGFFPAYHMSKENWITAALDGSAPDHTIRMLLDMSFERTRPKAKRAARRPAETGHPSVSGV